MSYIISLYKYKMFDRKPMRWHHCNIIENVYIFEHFVNFCTMKFIVKCLNCHGSAHFSTLVRCQSSLRPSGDCVLPKFRTSFGHSSFNQPRLWNSLPTDLKLQTDKNTFNRGQKQARAAHMTKPMYEM